MHIRDLISNNKLLQVLEVLLETKGVIHGGVLRDLIVGAPFKDIDVYYDSSSNLMPSDQVFNSRIFDSLRNRFKCKELLSDYKLDWINEPLDDYGYELGTETLSLYKNNNSFNINLLYFKESFAPANFLDFDINSLYVLPDGTISSFLGHDSIDKVVKNIVQKQCKLLRPDLSSDRIKYILDKGYKCNLSAFL